MQLIHPCPPESFWISQVWGENPDIYSRWGYGGHNGLDYAITIGTSIMAIAPGRVTVVGWDEHGYGLWCEVSHDFGRSRYAHGNPGSARVQVGEDVQQGQLLMDGGNSGFSTGPHLHLELRVSDSPATYGVAYYPTRWGSYCIDPGPFMPEPEGQGLLMGDDDMDKRVTKLEAELRQERARAELNYTKMLDSMSDLAFTIRAMNRAGEGIPGEDRPKLSELNEKWAGKI